MWRWKRVSWNYYLNCLSAKELTRHILLLHNLSLTTKTSRSLLNNLFDFMKYIRMCVSAELWNSSANKTPLLAHEPSYLVLQPPTQHHLMIEFLSRKYKKKTFVLSSETTTISSDLQIVTNLQKKQSLLATLRELSVIFDHLLVVWCEWLKSWEWDAFYIIH